jgi:hypothetical protein
VTAARWKSAALRAAAASFFVIALSLPLTSCEALGAPTVELKGQTFIVEIADEESEQIRGLMFRREMAADHGMLFVYPASQPLSYWMRDCFIPLDILYFDDQGRFINGHYRVPGCRGSGQCPTYASTRPARYVLELNGGVGQAMHLVEGDRLRLPK